MTGSHYVTTGRLRFRFVQVLLNAIALLAIAGGLAAYFKSEWSISLQLQLKCFRCDTTQYQAVLNWHYKKKKQILIRSKYM